MRGRAVDRRRLVVLLTAGGLVLLGCGDDAAMTTPSAAADGVADGWMVHLLDTDHLGDDWQARDLPDPAAGVVDGLCGVPDVLVHFPPERVVRYEGDAVVTHALIETDDAPGLASGLVTELDLCDEEDDRVTASSRVELDVEVPPTDTFELRFFHGFTGTTSEAVWAITTVDERHVSVVGASITDLFEDPDDPLTLVRSTVDQVYERPAG